MSNSYTSLFLSQSPSDADDDGRFAGYAALEPLRARILFPNWRRLQVAACPLDKFSNASINVRSYSNLDALPSRCQLAACTQLRSISALLQDFFFAPEQQVPGIRVLELPRMPSGTFDKMPRFSREQKAHRRKAMEAHERWDVALTVCGKT